MFVIVSGGVARIDPALRPAAWTLGARWPLVLWKIELPALLPYILSGALFAFIVVFDEVVLAVFLLPPGVQTLPLKMLSAASEAFSPELTAASTLVSVLAIVVLAIVPLVIGRGTRRAGRARPRRRGPPGRSHRMTIALSITDVEVTLGANHVLKGVSLDVQPGEFVTLLGASGSGKSTLLNVIAGLQSVDAGHVAFDGQNVERLAPQEAQRRRRLPVVRAVPAPLDRRENVAFPLSAARRPRAERRRSRRRCSALVQLPGMADRCRPALSADSASAWPWPALSPRTPASCCWTSRWRPSTSSCAKQMQVEITRIQRQVGITTVSVTHDQTRR